MSTEANYKRLEQELNLLIDLSRIPKPVDTSDYLSGPDLCAVSADLREWVKEKAQQAEPVAWAYHVTGQRFDRRGVCMAEGDLRETEAAFKAHGCSVKVTPLYEHPAPAQTEQQPEPKP